MTPQERAENYMRLKDGYKNKEEQKQHLINMMQDDEELGLYEETLEEAAIKNYKELYEGEPLTQDVPIDAFIKGAKWQQERMYSEKEVLKFTQTILMQYKFGNTDIEQMDLLRETFQLFKKK